jgi:hypothetical protein
LYHRKRKGKNGKKWPLMILKGFSCQSKDKKGNIFPDAFPKSLSAVFLKIWYNNYTSCISEKYRISVGSGASL